VPRKRRKRAKGKSLKLVGARGNNLKDVTAEIPLGTFTCITGVSAAASRRSSSTRSTRPWRASSTAPRAPAPHDRIEGLEHLDKVIDIDQSPDRPHAALEPGHLYRRLHADPRMVRRACPRPRRAATGRAASPST
jgi:excinuclease UvrABC ATPase subunit